MAWPPAARAQQGEPIRRIGALFPAPKDDPDYQPWMAAFLKALQELGSTEGRNMHSISTGLRPILPRFANRRRNWWRSSRTSFWHLGPRS